MNILFIVLFVFVMDIIYVAFYVSTPYSQTFLPDMQLGKIFELNLLSSKLKWLKN